MRIAFFGGSFDPPHCGHLAIASAALERLSLDRVLFAPAGRQPLKRDARPSSYEDRCTMVELAIAGSARFELSQLDAPQPGGRPNYTIDTLHRLKGTLNPADELFCLLGADSFLMLPQWHRAAELLLTCDFIVAARPGFELSDLAVSLPAGLVLSAEAERECLTYRLREATGGRSSKLYILPDLEYAISATAIRSALATGTAGDGLLPASVVEYIEHHLLYREAP